MNALISTSSNSGYHTLSSFSPICNDTSECFLVEIGDATDESICDAMELLGESNTVDDNFRLFWNFLMYDSGFVDDVVDDGVETVVLSLIESFLLIDGAGCKFFGLTNFLGVKKS